MGKINTVIGDIQVGNATSAPRPSSTISVKANLQADAATVANWDPQNPAGTSNWATSVTLYDAIGKAYPTQVYFRKDPANAGAWEWHAMVDGALVQNGTAGTPSQIAGGTLQFDSQGRLTTVQQSSTFNPLGQAAAQQLTFDFGSVYDPVVPGSGLQGITQFATASATTLVSQDGFGSGALTSIEIDKTGVVLGVFSNGQTRDLGQVGVARVTAPDQLERIGGNLFAATRNSGEPVIGAAGEGGRAFISSGTLEQSNVDIAEQFVRMIAAQRAFEANSKTITTSDQLLSELIQLKR
jgi:flagellar hook protein FlgE